MAEITIKRQTKNTISMTVSDGSNPVDLTGYAAQMDLRNVIDKSLALSINSSDLTGSRIDITDPANGAVSLIFVTADTADLSESQYKSDVAFISGGEVVLRVPLDVVIEDFVTEVA